MRVSEWITPGKLDELAVSLGRDTSETLRLFFLKSGNEKVATIILDNKRAGWIVGDIFFLAGPEIAKEFARLNLHTEKPLADNVLSSAVTASARFGSQHLVFCDSSGVPEAR